MHEFDILRSSEHDLSNAVLWDKIKALLSQGNAVLLMSPPCDTWSRVRHARPGPPPLRSLAHPWGFPWLANKHREAVESANTLIKFCCELAVFAHSHQVPFIMEHPEDLGLAQDGVRPASIWQLDIVQDLVPSCNSITFAFFQCAYGAASAKPTRLISNLAAWTLQVPSYSGFPHFDSGGRYRGPLPPRCGHRHPPLMGRDVAAWRTAASAAYPPLMNRWLVESVLLSSPAAIGVGSSSTPHSPSAQVPGPALAKAQGVQVQGLAGSSSTPHSPSAQVPGPALAKAQGLAIVLRSKVLPLQSSKALRLISPQKVEGAQVQCPAHAEVQGAHVQGPAFAKAQGAQVQGPAVASATVQSAAKVQGPAFAKAQGAQVQGPAIAKVLRFRSHLQRCKVLQRSKVLRSKVPPLQRSKVHRFRSPLQRSKVLRFGVPLSQRSKLLRSKAPPLQRSKVLRFKVPPAKVQGARVHSVLAKLEDAQVQGPTTAIAPCTAFCVPTRPVDEFEMLLDSDCVVSDSAPDSARPMATGDFGETTAPDVLCFTPRE